MGMKSKSNPISHEFNLAIIPAKMPTVVRFAMDMV